MVVSCPLADSMINPRLQTSSPSELADWLLARVPGTEAARVEAPKADSDAITTSLLQIQTVNLTSITSNLNSPTLLVHGLNDPVLAAPRFEDLVSLPEKAHFIAFEQSGHFPMLDENSKFHRLLGDFLSLPSGESPRQLQLKEEWKRRVR